MSFIVIYGSAAAFAAGKSSKSPRDLDVAFGRGISFDEVTRRAEGWAKEHGLEGLWIDYREYKLLPPERHGDLLLEDGTTQVCLAPTGLPQLLLPTPVGIEGVALILEGQGQFEICWQERKELPALLRLAEENPEEALRRLTAGGALLGIDSAGEVEAAEGDVGYAGDGPEALRTALKHVGEDFLSQPELGEFGEVLRRIKAAGTEWPGLIRFAARSQAETAAGVQYCRVWWARREDGHWEGGFPYAAAKFTTAEEFWQWATDKRVSFEAPYDSRGLS
jgi:hypothetical protein